jgi:CheY-like chemotaxis protein
MKGGLATAKTILIVEDQYLNMKLLTDLLEAHGYKTLQARDGAEGIEMARRYRPDLILLDRVAMIEDGNMARARSIRNTTPSLSVVPRDKLKEALGFRHGEQAAHGFRSDRYERAPLYFDALWTWYQNLDSIRQELVLDIIDAWAFPDRQKGAERWAVQLPPAPAYPRELE